MTEEDNNFLWKNRVHCRSYPHSLPKLVLSTSLDSLEKSTQLYTLLLDWPPISVVTALQCFLHEINDPHIREVGSYFRSSNYKFICDFARLAFFIPCWKRPNQGLFAKPELNRTTIFLSNRTEGNQTFNYK